MKQEKSALIARRIASFPPLPATVGNVLAVNSNPDSSAQDLLQAILPDPALCATVLKVANSAFFAQSRKVSTLERAVVVLGFNEIRDIVLGKAVFSSFKQFNRASKEELALFWEHSFCCGLAAKIIAEQIACPASELFIAGLLHDLGKLMLLLSYPGEYRLLPETPVSNDFMTIGSEQEEYGVSHDQAGMLLLNHWMFPVKLINAVGYHHQPAAAPENTMYALIVQLADLLAQLYLSPAVYSADDIAALTESFSLTHKTLWQKNHHPWIPQQIGGWFGMLAENHQQNQNILDIFND